MFLLKESSELLVAKYKFLLRKTVLPKVSIIKYFFDILINIFCSQSYIFSYKSNKFMVNLLSIHANNSIENSCA